MVKCKVIGIIAYVREGFAIVDQSPNGMCLGLCKGRDDCEGRENEYLIFIGLLICLKIGWEGLCDNVIST